MRRRPQGRPRQGEHERGGARARGRARVAHAAAHELVDEGAQAEVAVGSGHDGRRMRPALVLLHGFTQTRQSWRRTVQALQGRYRAITPDLPGHGQSGQRTASFAAMTAYVRALEPNIDRKSVV